MGFGPLRPLCKVLGLEERRGSFGWAQGTVVLPGVVSYGIC